MSHLEPSYLRYIYDGLEKGELHPDNAAALPEGITGLYEEAFEESKPARERQKLLETFAIWALLKKEVSAHFVAEILEVPSQEIVDFIATYSSWFTSPESGKYQLYHERLKLYLLQKLSEQEIATLHNKLVTRLEQALAEQKQDDFELYGLEVLSLHLFTTAMITGDGTKLIALSYDQKHWQRQLKLSKGYDWTKKGLKQVMTWAFKFNEEEIIECGLQMVDLHHQEQNDAPQIVALVAHGDVDTALKRIEAFGGNNKEGLQRKFILYMLCLMELTLLDSKDKPFRKEVIEKLLKHFDENLPIDHSILNWDDFFPSYLMFQIAFECSEMGMDYLSIYKRTDNWKSEWISAKGPYSLKHFELLSACAQYVSDPYSYWINNFKLAISSEYAKQGNMERAIEIERDISGIWYRINAILLISSAQFKLGQLENAQFTIKQAIEFVNNIIDESDKSRALHSVSIELAKQGKLKKSLKLVRSISNESEKSCALAAISSEIFKNGKYEEANLLTKEALEYARCIREEEDKSKTLTTISIEIAKQSKNEQATIILEEALVCAHKIEFDFFKKIALTDISIALVKNGNLEEAISCASDINDDFRDILAFENISNELAKKGDIQQALECLKLISSIEVKSRALSTIYSELLMLGRLSEVIGLMQETLSFAKGINDEKEKCRILDNISKKLIEQGNLEESLKYINSISLNYVKSLAITNTYIELIARDQLDIALNYNRELKDEKMMSMGFSEISKVLAKEGLHLKASLVMDEALNCANAITNEYDKSNALQFISEELANQSLFQEAVKCVQNISNGYWKSIGFSKISTDFFMHNKLIEANSCMEKAIEFCHQSNLDEFHENLALMTISINLAKQGKLEDALKHVLKNREDIEHSDSTKSEKSITLSAISSEMKKQNKLQESFTAMELAIDCARGIGDEFWKSLAINAISIEIISQGNWLFAEQLGFEISSINNRQNYWKNLGASNILEISNWQIALQDVNQLKSNEARLFYLKGWAENVSVYDANLQLIIKPIPYFFYDTLSLEKILQQYALNQLFFENLPEEKIQRYNRTLNIQWAIDIKN